MLRFRWIVLLSLMALTISVRGQDSKEYKRIFLDAEYLYQTGFYEEAFNRYKNLLRLDPDNSNVLFRCGACCLNLPARELQSISYLEEAAKNVNLSYVVRSQTETGAPVLTYFMLARAYHLNNQFDLATAYYQKYIDSGMNEDPLQVEYARLQINAAERAKYKIGKAPDFLFESVLDKFIKDLPSCNNPVISGDGNILIFLVDYPSDKKIMMTTREGDYFKEPWTINTEIGLVGETYPVSLSYDGTELYVVHEYYLQADILMSKYENGAWTEAKPLSHQINKRTSENHASISKDGRSLYFTSDMRGGYGSYDIYVSRKDAKDKWGPAENVGPEINTPYEEATPFISSTDSVLFFSSQGHDSYGGHDVYFSEIDEDGNWQKPLNVGYPVSTTGENLFFNPGWGEFEGFYAVRRRSDPGSNTINMVIKFDKEMQEAFYAVKELDSLQLLSELDLVTTIKKAVTERRENAESGSDLVALALASLEAQPEVQESDYKSREENVKRREEIPEADPVQKVTIQQASFNSEKRDIVPTNATLSTLPYTIISGIPFDYNAHELSVPGIVEVEKIFDLMQSYPDVRIELSGHADAKGSAQYNMDISLKRVRAVKRYLTSKGIHPDRIDETGKGEFEPVARNQNPDGSDAPTGRFLNRQVKVTFSGIENVDLSLTNFYVPESLRRYGNEGGAFVEVPDRYTIQVSASRNRLNIEKFRDLEDLKEYDCIDGYFRYTSGEFSSKKEAYKRQKELNRSGYSHAYVQPVQKYLNASR